LPGDGTVFAEPLYLSALNVGGTVHNVVFLATEHNSVYAYDADSGSKLWQTSVTGNGESTSDNRNCSVISPEIGITATPVIDRGAGPHGAIYVVAMSRDGFPNKQDYGNSYVKLSTAGNTLSVADYFAMWNEISESNADLDLGAGGPMLLPDLTDITGTVKHLGFAPVRTALSTS
jgi:outer membrane protein assembly factor BamB